MWGERKEREKNDLLSQDSDNPPRLSHPQTWIPPPSMPLELRSQFVYVASSPVSTSDGPRPRIQKGPDPPSPEGTSPYTLYSPRLRTPLQQCSPLSVGFTHTSVSMFLQSLVVTPLNTDTPTIPRTVRTCRPRTRPSSSRTSTSCQIPPTPPDSSRPRRTPPQPNITSQSRPLFPPPHRTFPHGVFYGFIPPSGYVPTG